MEADSHSWLSQEASEGFTWEKGRGGRINEKIGEEGGRAERIKTGKGPSQNLCIPLACTNIEMVAAGIGKHVHMYIYIAGGYSRLHVHVL